MFEMLFYKNFYYDRTVKKNINKWNKQINMLNLDYKYEIITKRMIKEKKLI